MLLDIIARVLDVRRGFWRTTRSRERLVVVVVVMDGGLLEVTREVEDLVFTLGLGTRFRNVNTGLDAHMNSKGVRRNKQTH